METLPFGFWFLRPSPDSCTEYGVPAPARGTRYRSAAQVRVRSARRVFRALFLAFDAISIFILNLDKRKKERSAFVL